MGLVHALDLIDSLAEVISLIVRRICIVRESFDLPKFHDRHVGISFEQFRLHLEAFLNELLDTQLALLTAWLLKSSLSHSEVNCVRDLTRCRVCNKVDIGDWFLRAHCLLGEVSFVFDYGFIHL